MLSDVREFDEDQRPDDVESWILYDRQERTFVKNVTGISEPKGFYTVYMTKSDGRIDTHKETGQPKIELVMCSIRIYCEHRVVIFNASYVEAENLKAVADARTEYAAMTARLGLHVH